MSAPASSPSPLPPQLYAYGTTSAMGLMAAALVWPPLSPYAVGWMAAIPVLSALWVAVTNWRTDRQLSAAALLAVLGLAAVFFGRGLLT
ncbi:hypothetical protein Deipr_0788 [Deinococcus proteolyticus MRP]|uniref:Uncharacterized protein n=1 Tax=Deinococcus proteolyticus (strain ATCC 35074 / DSM 20540 / JCM 6276 / NBRC 101906 / NCIMB 13154 / VKM Ac-1939 / CCM 2703 / MRP) TaxID=693977 RepID=F0RM24_DEIPM|nr:MULTISPECIES: hypothetical protein [Deinococcus]ADY25944.1 hypothetical protein Deipr_0788 [Deinococcus proteolyticus MRP]MCY1702065.1 hypothetical protein [Deinococcus sp. SL84]